MSGSPKKRTMRTRDSDMAGEKPRNVYQWEAIISFVALPKSQKERAYRDWVKAFFRAKKAKKSPRRNRNNRNATARISGTP